MSNVIGAYATEQDFSHYVTQAAKTTLAVVGKADRGPINQPTLVTSTRELIEKFGDLRDGYYGMYAAYLFLQQSSSVYFVRAGSLDATHAECSVNYDTQGPIGELKFTMKNPGTHYNDYSLDIKHTGKIETDTDPAISETYHIYDIKLLDSNGKVIEQYNSVSTVDMATRLSSSRYFNFTVFPESDDSPDISASNSAIVFENGPGGGPEDWMSGVLIFNYASDGLAPTDNDYVTAINSLSSESIDMNIVAVPGQTSQQVLNALEVLANGTGSNAFARRDFYYLVDTPSADMSKEDIIKWREGETVGDYDSISAIDSSYAALYYNWVTLYDSYNKMNVQVPPSVIVAATTAKSDKLADVWYAPAGLKRGVVKGVVEVHGLLNKADIKKLYDHGINSIYKHPTAGVVLWGQKTLQKENTALNRINVRRMMNYLKKIVVATCDYLTFDPNDRITWNSFKMKVEPILKDLKKKRALYDYRLIAGEAIVTEDDIDNHKMPCKILVRPTKTAEEIPIGFVITSTGADFDDMLANNSLE